MSTDFNFPWARSPSLLCGLIMHAGALEVGSPPGRGEVVYMHVYIQSVWEAKYTCSCKVHIQLKYFLSLPNSSMGYQLQTAGKWAGSVNVPTVLWRSLGSMQMHFILFSWCIPKYTICHGLHPTFLQTLPTHWGVSPLRNLSGG